MEDEHPTAVPGDVDARIVAVGVPVEDVHGADLRVPLHTNGHGGRNDHLEVADSDPRIHVRLTPRQLHPGEVEVEPADSELVPSVHVCRGRGYVRLGSDPVVQVDVERRRDCLPEIPCSACDEHRFAGEVHRFNADC